MIHTYVHLPIVLRCVQCTEPHALYHIYPGYMYTTAFIFISLLGMSLGHNNIMIIDVITLLMKLQLPMHGTVKSPTHNNTQQVVSKLSPFPPKTQ